MKVEFWVIGKTASNYLKEGNALYTKRLQRYLPFEMRNLPDIKNAGKLKHQQLKLKEAEMVLKQLQTEDYLILLDERGKQMRSVDFADWMEQKLQLPFKRLIFLVGGAFGFDETLYKRSQFSFSLSKMTFSHQMIRLFFLEQLYRAMTILKNEPYHNEG